MKTSSLLRAAALALACGGVLTGCGDDKQTTPPLPNTTPVAAFTAARSWSGTDVVFLLDASPSTDPQDAAESLRVRWDWESDGTWDTEFTTAKTAELVRGAGHFPVTLEVKDTGGLKSDTTNVVEWDGYLPQSSPSYVLLNLQRSYMERNLDRYAVLFRPDFVFVFNPADVLNPDHPTPPSWFRDEELVSATNMFVDDRVESIQIALTLGTAEPADSAIYGPATLKVPVDRALLRVNTRSEDGAPLSLFVPGTKEVFYFRLDPEHPAIDGRPLCSIVRWEDQPIGALTEEGWSWGKVKALFK